MAVFKCKMCGGTLDIAEGVSVCECDYCGSKQTLPKLTDDKKKNLYDRASHFRRNNEYDKAMDIYEQILNEDVEDAESYWSLVLCTYGIEYVEDPATHRRVPTVNRAQLTSILADENYKSALHYADALQREIYENEAKEIEQIQKGILEISSKEEPFDVFICYKESDANGRRTPDSVLANDLYHQLTQEGFKVFFARITLEDKLGSAYEPYIFAALNSAKVMVVLGTRPEYFTAVWVKNEWSRFLAQIKGGARKVLIPAYRDMDPYDLPEEFSHLQAQDMSKLGFMQDLIRGIKKLTGADEKKAEPVTHTETTSSAGSAANTLSFAADALVKRAFLFLEDGEFERADELCEQALNQDPENAMAYVGKVLVRRKLHKIEELSEEAESLTQDSDFQKALRFADSGLKRELEQYVCNQAKSLILNEISKLDLSDDATYKELERKFHQQERSFFENIVGQIDDTILKKVCAELSDNFLKTRLELVYQKAQSLVQSTMEFECIEVNFQTIKQRLELAIKYFDSISEYKDSSAQREHCNTLLNGLSEKQNEARYNAAVRQIKSAQKTDVSSGTFFERAFNGLLSSIRTFESIPEYKDSSQLREQCIMTLKQLLEKKVNETNVFNDGSVQLTVECLEKAKEIAKTVTEEVRIQLNETCNGLMKQLEQALLFQAEELIQQAKLNKNIDDVTWKLKQAERICCMLENSEALQNKLIEIEQIMKPLEGYKNKKHIVQAFLLVLVLVSFAILALTIKKGVVQVLILAFIFVFFVIPIAIIILDKILND